MAEVMKPRVRWRRVTLFYGLAFGWVCLVALGILLAKQPSLVTTGMSTAVIAVLAFLYMPAPLVAALITERLDQGRPKLIRSTFTGFKAKLPRLLWLVVAVATLTLAGMLAASWLGGNLLGLPGFGRVLTSHQDLVANSLMNVPAADADQVATISDSLPPFWGLIALSLGGALLAGFTVNGLFAFGEEYGWRGWLADELRPLGAFWANVITGVLWGLWHAPLILMGFNYGEYGKLGVFFMVALCIPFSFLLWRSREVTGSLLAPAMLHGAFNGFAGVFLLILADPHPLIAPPVGLVGAGVLAVVAGLMWLLPVRRTVARVEPEPALAQD